jgi:hypothetical protein
MAFSLRKKSLFNFSIDAMEPLLGALCSFLISGDLCLQLPDSIFGGMQLIRQLLSRLQCVSAVFFRNTGRSVQHLQDRLTCFVELISVLRG